MVVDILHEITMLNLEAIKKQLEELNKKLDNINK